MTNNIQGVTKTTKKHSLIFSTLLTGLAVLLATHSVSAAEPPTRGNATDKPIIFDVEALRETYFDDWRIEAEADDVISASQPSETEAAGSLVTYNVEALRETYFNDWRIEAEAVDMNAAGEPVTDDVETLRQNYFNDWMIEADAAE